VENLCKKSKKKHGLEAGVTHLLVLATPMPGPERDAETKPRRPHRACTIRVRRSSLGRLRNALGAAARLCHRNSRSRILLRNEYLAAENRILRGRIKDRLLLSEGEKATLAEFERHWRTWRQRPSPKRFWVGIGSSSRTNLMGTRTCVAQGVGRKSGLGLRTSVRNPRYWTEWTETQFRDPEEMAV